ncbi:type IV pili methyl-accepting chemotaxis transducer N-terminal domain-containing protein [Roseibium sp.]|uniref:type IV pili methyl-accepting chemotaxis transducer N-terminal domain-containing protein n=1 Tax=Roseibium sp. TaxID=1936156 RepID=UPI003B52090D
MTQPELNENTFARLINIAGRQRMLSQRVGFLSVVLNSAQKQTEDQELRQSDSRLEMLKIAAADFERGFAILRQGDPAQDLPFWDSDGIRAILAGTGSQKGLRTISHFMTETRHTISVLESGKTRPDQELEAFSTFVLTDVLGVLQQIVTALEHDFQIETAKRQKQRDQEIDRVRAAVEEIQRASKFSRLIALNAKISANRAGQHGSEFRALTDEIKQISDDITESSDDIIRFLAFA